MKVEYFGIGGRLVCVSCGRDMYQAPYNRNKPGESPIFYCITPSCKQSEKKFRIPIQEAESIE